MREPRLGAGFSHRWPMDAVNAALVLRHHPPLERPVFLQLLLFQLSELSSGQTAGDAALLVAHRAPILGTDSPRRIRFRPHDHGIDHSDRLLDRALPDALTARSVRELGLGPSVGSPQHCLRASGTIAGGAGLGEASCSDHLECQTAEAWSQSGPPWYLAPCRWSCSFSPVPAQRPPLAHPPVPGRRSPVPCWPVAAWRLSPA